MSSAEGGDEINILTTTVYFCGSAVGILVLECGAVRFARRGRERHPGDGFFQLYTWPDPVKLTVTLLMMVLGALPLLSFGIALALGALLAAIEGWSYREGFEYVVSNILGIGPLVAVSPDTTVGVVADIIISCWAMLLSTTVLGLSASLSLTMRWLNSIHPTAWGFLRALMLYVPILMLVLSAIAGAALAYIEAWDFKDGFLFMVSHLCGLQTPLTEVSPTNDDGNFFVAFCTLIELLLGGAIVGVVGNHPTVQHFMNAMQGVDDEEARKSSKPKEVPVEGQLKKDGQDCTIMTTSV